MNPLVELNLTLILFLPWFAILGTLYWLFPRRPRGAARVLYDAISAQNGTRDVYRLMRSPKSRLVVPLQTVLDRLGALRAQLLTVPASG